MPDTQPSNAPTDSETEVTGVDPAAAQSNVGRENMRGSGEWPSPSTPPSSPVAPGPGPDAAERDDAAEFQPPAAGSRSQDDEQQTGRTGGDRGPARLDEGPSGFAAAQERDPVAGGTATTDPHDSDD